MSGVAQPELREALDRAENPRAELARRVKKAVKTMRENVDGETAYAEPPGAFDPLERIVQERDAEGGLFIQTAGIHRADVLMALLELSEAEAGALWGEYDGPPEVEEEIREARTDTETASWQARRARQEATSGQ